ncbi:PHD finger domain [Cordyceps militaris]|uniref:Transcription factor BYE1 n=1 Tax=Cordyceps militaris TaxID=73501 RepID=A0A2H4SLF9_CORMI|nr:PHD finger domain [Cordyceps militaris]
MQPGSPLLATHANSCSPGEPEPRRSVRATKGQHTKSFDELEQLAVPKRRQTKKSRKALDEEEQSQEPEEIIRCVCGATEQDEDSGEAWISCETCYAWQHNVCVGVSSYEDEIPEYYWCEQCRPQEHKVLLDGIAKGEQPWIARRKAHEEEVASRKRRGGRKPKAKRASDPKDDIEKDGRGKAKASPAPDASAKERRESGGRPGKRKSRDDSQDGEPKACSTEISLPLNCLLIKAQNSKLRRVPANESSAGGVEYTPPADLATAISELPTTRAGPARALRKSILHVLSSMEKNKTVKIPKDSSAESMSETNALQIERAVFDTHPATKGQKEYNQQIKSLTFNLKNNPELVEGLVQKTHSPAGLAVMTSEQLASAEMQKQTAEMKAKAEKQSILYTADTGPRVRRTHKGEEVVEDESLAITNELPIPRGGGARRGAATDPSQAIKRESLSTDYDMAQSPKQQDDQRSPSQSKFDISEVFSQVKSPTQAQRRRPSAPVLNTSGPGFDPDVDRMLEDENDSPPYSPTEDSTDPDIVWRGSLAMSSIADFQATGKHVGGANFANLGHWSKLIPKRMTVAGRITEQSAIEYLCSLRYSNLTDIVVVGLAPTSPEAQPEYNALVDYFVSKKRYGVVGNKAAGNVRDTYLVPVPPGENNHPEFMLNLVDNFIPQTRTEPLLLAVFVYRNEPSETLAPQDEQVVSPSTPAIASAPNTEGYAQRSNSIPGPGFSPATPRGGFAGSPSNNGTTPGGGSQFATPIPSHLAAAPLPPAPTPPNASNLTSPPPPFAQMTEAQKVQAQQAAQQTAREVLGAFVKVPTVQFLLPQAHQMARREWEIIKSVYEREPRARDDLQYLSVLLEKEGGPKQP